MQTGGRHSRVHLEQHRDAVLVNAVQVFCTFVQHDIARMQAAGITGDAKALFSNAVKHQLLRGIGTQMSRVVDSVIDHADHMPTFTRSSDRQLVSCIMQNYPQSLQAVRQGSTTARQYRTDVMVPSIMEDGHRLSEEETTDHALDAFTISVWECIDEWERYTPVGHFASIIHNTVLNHTQ